MGCKPTIGSKLAIEALDQYPGMATKTLAHRLHELHPQVFPTLESARYAVRYRRGAMGEQHRRAATHPRSKADAEQCRTWGALLPDPQPLQWAWRELPAKVKRWLVIADLHIPYHDKAALEIVLQHAWGNCDGILIVGDLVDAYQCSDFCRDPRNPDPLEEVKAASQFLDALKVLRPKAIMWKGGNHELRLERYLMRRAAEVWPLLAGRINWQTVCELDKRKILWVRPQDPIRHHQLAIVHGHEWAKGFVAPVNPARGAFLRAGECVLSAHLHRKSNHPEQSIFGRLVQCWSVGCLCHMHPDYAPLNKWDQGFAYLTTGSGWRVENYSIVNGAVL